MTNIEAYTRFISGTDSGPLGEIIFASDTTSLKRLLLGAGECFSESERQKDSDEVIDYTGYSDWQCEQIQEATEFYDHWDSAALVELPDKYEICL